MKERIIVLVALLAALGVVVACMKRSAHVHHGPQTAAGGSKQQQVGEVYGSPAVSAAASSLDQNESLVHREWARILATPEIVDTSKAVGGIPDKRRIDLDTSESLQQRDPPIAKLTHAQTIAEEQLVMRDARQYQSKMSCAGLPSQCTEGTADDLFMNRAAQFAAEPTPNERFFHAQTY